MSKLIYDPYWFIGMCFVYSFIWYLIEKVLSKRISIQDKHNHNLAKEKAEKDPGAWDAGFDKEINDNLFFLILKMPVAQWSRLHTFYVLHRFVAYIIAVVLIVVFFTFTWHGHEYTTN